MGTRTQRAHQPDAEIGEGGLPIYSEEEKDRLTREAIEQADREGTIPHEEVVAYFESLMNGKPLPKPRPRKE